MKKKKMMMIMLMIVMMMVGVSGADDLGHDRGAVDDDSGNVACVEDEAIVLRVKVLMQVRHKEGYPSFRQPQIYKRAEDDTAECGDESH